jgi:anti-sigma factor RsiW
MRAADRRQHIVNVFIWPSAQQGAETLRNVTVDTYHLVQWSASGLTFWAVSDLSGADLESLARLFQELT